MYGPAKPNYTKFLEDSIRKFTFGISLETQIYGKNPLAEMSLHVSEKLSSSLTKFIEPHWK